MKTIISILLIIITLLIWDISYLYGKFTNSQIEINSLQSQINVMKMRPSQSYTASVSAYCLCEQCCQKWSKIYPRRTASGHVIKPTDKFCAAPPEIPFGTMINIPGYGTVKVEDRGGAITKNRIDVYFNDHETALRWGRQYLEVKIKKELNHGIAD